MKTPLYSSAIKAEISSCPQAGLFCSACKWLALAASLILIAAGARAQVLTNWLSNAGFELGTAGWVNMPPWTWNGASFGVQDTNQYVYSVPQQTTIHVTVHGGTNAFKIWGYFQPYATAPGAMQTFPCAPGSTWTASGWASTQTPDTMTSTETSYIEVQFLDATTNTITYSDFSSATLTPAGPVSTWMPFQVADLGGNTNLTAPGGTAFIRFLVRFTQPAGYPGGSTYWDDLQLIRTSKPDPEITKQPVSQTVVYGQTATFSVVADGQTTLSYKWQDNGADITDPNAHGVNTATLTLSNVTSSSQGTYTCIVSDSSGGPLTSDPAQLTVSDPGILSITPPLGQTVTNGGTAKITVNAAGSTPPTYSWLENNNPISDGGHFSGTTTSNLTVANATGTEAGTYTVYVDSGLAQASSMLKVVPGSLVATNLLINPGFEDGVFSEPWESAWTIFNGAALATANDNYNNSTTPVSVYAGAYVCRTYAGSYDNGLYQNLPATAGATYHAGGRFYVSSLDPVIYPAWVVLQVMFKNAGGANLVTFTAPQINTNFTMDAWTALQVTNATGGADLVAPAGTVSMTCQVYEYAQQGGGGSVYFDNLFLSQTAVAPPPPPPPFSITPSVSGGQFHVSFPTTNGATYEVLYSDNVATPQSQWRTNSTVMGDGTVKSVADTLGAAARFYRVRAHN